MTEEIKPDSRQKILEAAIAEFAARGYEAASTNRICQQAEISKGLLFHYYKSKHQLFAEAVSQCVQDVERASFMPAGAEPYTTRDVQEFCRRQMRFFAGHFDHYVIIGGLIWGTGCELDPEQERLRKELTDYKSARFRCFLDHCRLRPEVDRDVALELILNVTDQIQKKYISRIQHRREAAETVLSDFREEYRKALGMLLNGIVMPSGDGAGEDQYAAGRN